jgi:hypothetical protein
VNCRWFEGFLGYPREGNGANPISEQESLALKGLEFRTAGLISMINSIHDIKIDPRNTNILI